MATLSAESEALPGLALFADRERLCRELSRLVQVPLADAAVAVRRLVPGKRCVFDLSLDIRRPDGSAERRRLIGKLYNKQQGASAYEAITALRAVGFATGRALVPEPVAYDPAWRLLLLTWAEGEVLAAALLTRPDVTAQVIAAAEWLASFHRSGIAVGRPYSFSRQLHTLAGWQRRIADVWPETERALAGLLRRIEDRGAALSGWAPGPTHRDFSPDHLVFAGDRVTVLDFDEFCQYDPLFDVAHFTAHVRLISLVRQGTLHHFDPLIAAFETAYAERVPPCQQRRLALHRAIACCKLAHIIAVVLRPPDWQQLTEDLLQEALRESGERS